MGGWRCGYLRRSREGSDYTTINLYFVSHVFQSTLPRRERRPANGRFRCAPPHFNPRSREGSDSTLCGGNLFLICISIHAPAKGATSDASSGAIGRCYFNPRSREGSDQAAAKESRGGGNFNPRSREGSDVGRCNLERLTAISIHAPAKGATYFDYLKVSVRIFQSTLPRRERRERKLHNKQTDIISIHAPAKGATSRPTSISSTAAFQSTLPRRERRINSSFRSHRARFQSTLPRRERPLARPRLAVRTVISIHAPAKGATVQPHRGGHGIPISIHAPAKGATLRRHGADIYTIQFQSTLPRRERHKILYACG